MPDDPDWRAELDAAGELRPEIVGHLYAAHGDRALRAIQAVGEGRVKRYRDFVVVVGREDEYIVEDGYCTCKDAQYNLDAEDPEQQCYHALAVEIAERVDAVEAHDVWYSDVRDLV